MIQPLDFDGIPKEEIFSVLDFDFPLEDVEVEPDTEKDDWTRIQDLDLPFEIPGSLPYVGGVQQNDSSKPNKNLSTSYDKACRLKQLPSSAETTSTRSILLSHDSSDVKNVLFKTSSPVSILESTSSCFAENLRPVDQKFKIPVKRARTKHSRSRPSNFNRLCSLPFLSPTFSSSEFVYLESDSGTLQTKLAMKRPFGKKKNTFHFSDIEMRSFNFEEQSKTKKCTHCEVTSTPQWREGPLGPKTLCNACGVRFRSGRLYPEYRPAASPTFIPSLHSNSHKKVIEMRKKGSQVVNSSRAVVEPYCSQSGKSVRQLIV